MRVTASVVGTVLAGVAFAGIMSGSGKAQGASSGPTCQQAMDFVRTQAEGGVDMLEVYEKDEIEWAAAVELRGTANCPAIPANLKARYRGDSPPNLSHKRMNCHLAVDALYARYGNDMDAMPTQSADFFYEYVQAIKNGRSCPKVPNEAKLFAKGHKLTGIDEMYLTAAEAGDSDAVLEIAIRKIQSGDQDQGYDNLFLASDMGNPWADIEISELYRSLADDPVKSQEFAVKSAEAGVPWAMISAGRNYETGYGTKRDPAKAIAWYRRAAEAGNIGALPLAAVLIEKGQGVKKDRERAYELLRIGAGVGDVGSMSILGFMLLKRNDGEVSEEALAWVDKALERGHGPTVAWQQKNGEKSRRYFANLSERQKKLREDIRLGRTKRCTNTVNHCVRYVSTSNYSSQTICNSGIDYWNC